MDSLSFSCQVVQYKGVEGIDARWTPLFAAARTAAERAYSPYSRVSIGAALLLSNGEIVGGSNQENAAYPSGVCAERTALFSAFHQYPDSCLEAIAIVRGDRTEQGTLIWSSMPPSPCGACRQVLWESLQRLGTKTVPFFMLGTECSWCVEDARTLLPLAFLL